MGLVGANAHRPTLSQIIPCVHPFKQSISRVVFVLKNALCFSFAAMSLYSVHGGKVRANNPLSGLNDPLQGFPLSQGGVAIPHCDTAGEDTLNKAFVNMG